jgi:hypothetical protein
VEIQRDKEYWPCCRYGADRIVCPAGASPSLARLFASWESFFTSWFIHTIGVSVFSVFAAATIMGTHKFFVGDKHEGDIETLVFYVVMTVLIGAFAIGVVANAPIDDEDTRLLLSRLT